MAGMSTRSVLVALAVILALSSAVAQGGVAFRFSTQPSLGLGLEGERARSLAWRLFADLEPGRPRVWFGGEFLFKPDLGALTGNAALSGVRPYLGGGVGMRVTGQADAGLVSSLGLEVALEARTALFLEAAFYLPFGEARGVSRGVLGIVLR
ncbi:hypothetical protein Marky_1361 [Marinithermus hydrothermalis DSM 14884]|uniref:Outer membrane protein beta-barrel domain-containing protein n=2 Tax=Marinithermus TaxID=186191 RepID=F2NLJ7_MARHT|nr:hypothetical protein Marky_1361 [Marinithermus hydrothermalis DSM 14884]